jgi:aromatic-L-amino-acid decarboxylase
MSRERKTPIEIDAVEFKRIGYQLIDTISQFIDTIDEKPVTTGMSSKEIQDIIGTSALPENGRAPGKLLSEVSDILLNHSLLNGHPKFLGYITSSPAPIGALADLLACLPITEACLSAAATWQTLLLF